MFRGIGTLRAPWLSWMSSAGYNMPDCHNSRNVLRINYMRAERAPEAKHTKLRRDTHTHTNTRGLPDAVTFRRTKFHSVLHPRPASAVASGQRQMFSNSMSMCFGIGESVNTDDRTDTPDGALLSLIGRSLCPRIQQT